MFDVLFLAQADTAPQGLQGVDTETAPITEQPSGTSPGSDPGSEVPPSGGNPLSLLMLVAFVAFVYFFMIRGQQKKEKARKNMLTEVKKNDRVRTIGGIYGTVVEVREKELVIKIDESNNTRIRMVREAISEILSE